MCSAVGRAHACHDVVNMKRQATRLQGALHAGGGHLAVLCPSASINQSAIGRSMLWATSAHVYGPRILCCARPGCMQRVPAQHPPYATPRTATPCICPLPTPLSNERHKGWVTASASVRVSTDTCMRDRVRLALAEPWARCMCACLRVPHAHADSPAGSGRQAGTTGRQAGQARPLRAGEGGSRG